jgi:hypothetical protein
MPTTTMAPPQGSDSGAIVDPTQRATCHAAVAARPRSCGAEDGEEEFVETVAAGWSGQIVYVRLPDRRYRLTSVWLDVADVKRR